MNSILLSIILIPVIEIYLFIKIGAEIGAISTILLIFITAVVGVYYAKYEGLNTLKSGFVQISKNEPPTYEMLSGAAIAIAALLLIVPGFATASFKILSNCGGAFPSNPVLLPRIPLNLKKINPAIIAKRIISMYSKL